MLLCDDIGALNFFTSSLSTLCNKTMDDTLLTVKQYEAARLVVKLSKMMMMMMMMMMMVSDGDKSLWLFCIEVLFIFIEGEL